MDYILMLVVIIFSVCAAGIFKVYSTLNESRGVSAYTFNAGSCIMWLFVLVPLLSFGDARFTTISVIYGVVYGVLLFLYLLFDCRAVSSGPVSLTRLFACPSFIVATIFGIIYCKESVSVYQMVGMIMITFSVVLCVNPKFSGEKLSVRWFGYCFGFFLANGLIGIIYKLFGQVADKGQYDAMLIVAAITSILLYFVAESVETLKNKTKCRMPDKKILFLIIASGLMTCVSIRLNIYLANVIPSVVFFPVVNGSVIVLSTVMGKFVFKEKLSLIQIYGIIFGIISIGVIGCMDEVVKWFGNL